MIGAVGEPGFDAAVLDHVQEWMPAASWSVYRTGRRCRPSLYLSASRGIPDRTRECWWAYLSGPYLQDRSFDRSQPVAEHAPRLCHVTAQEIPDEHRARVYEPHGMMERVSIVDSEDDALFAVNFYRHAHQPAFTDAQIASFACVAVPVLALARKHIALCAADSAPRTAGSPVLAQEPLAASMPAGRMRERLLELNGELTAREVDVCVRLLQGMTHDGIAADLGLGLTTVKTYRNRAFDRLGIHFRNELFARVLGAS
ncbi:helix-turn-helix transcriptional regulator [Ramlibacter ginsenosidimutans]|uniref:Helix-turn-helix transcriptional regulator n=1 Tax=Ramlibacter ginsenosidimutans TaxID=502333 RepID=A0A934TPE2_9BURK|nr:helix-turn-helix transcriptional regulator [Ramlibacter ginsenosidimutans]MBK6005037.1 helix-turn-helix transcriptional regulator [Ramlibacter ginsenosidimutans]